MEEEESNPLLTLLDLFFAALLIFIGAFILLTFLGAMGGLYPSNPLLSAARSVYALVFGFFDNSFIYVAVILILVDIAKAYNNPSIAKGITNFLFLLGFVYIVINVRTDILNAIMPLNFNAIMPQTYTAITNNYLAILAFFALAIATGLNFRKKPTAQSRISFDNGGGVSDNRGY